MSDHNLPPDSPVTRGRDLREGTNLCSCGAVPGALLFAVNDECPVTNLKIHSRSCNGVLLLCGVGEGRMWELLPFV